MRENSPLCAAEADGNERGMDKERPKACCCIGDVHSKCPQTTNLQQIQTKHTTFRQKYGQVMNGEAVRVAVDCMDNSLARVTAMS